MLTAWVPFHDCDEQTGTITFVDGSHRWDDVGDLDFFDGRFEDAALAPAGQEIVRVPAVLRRDRSPSTTTAHPRQRAQPQRRPRRSMAIHLQVGDNRWQDVPPRPGARPTTATTSSPGGSTGGRTTPTRAVPAALALSARLGDDRAPGQEGVGERPRVASGIGSAEYWAT
jgi:hypothetical protein